MFARGVAANGYTGDTARALRVNQAYFEERRVLGRDMGEFTMTADQVFIVEIMNGTLAAEEITRQFPFLFTLSPDDDTMRELKGFFLTLYTVWRLNQQVFLDA